MRLTSSAHYSIFLLSSILGLSSASYSSHFEDDAPCVARSPTTGLYFDLNAISLSPPKMKDGNKLAKDARTESWYARGHDYPANFTINICAPVIENVTDVVGIESSRWKNVSAYYERDDKRYSIGYGRSLSKPDTLVVFPAYCANDSRSYTGNKHLNLSSVAANSFSIIPMARLVRTIITRAVPMPPHAISRLSCLSYVTATLRQTWPRLPSLAPWMSAHTSSKSVARRHVVESP